MLLPAALSSPILVIGETMELLGASARTRVTALAAPAHWTSPSRQVVPIVRVQLTRNQALAWRVCDLDHLANAGRPVGRVVLAAGGSLHDGDGSNPNPSRSGRLEARGSVRVEPSSMRDNDAALDWIHGDVSEARRRPSRAEPRRLGVLVMPRHHAHGAWPGRKAGIQPFSTCDLEYHCGSRADGMREEFDPIWSSTFLCTIMRRRSSSMPMLRTR
jgi:hypothetical protein